MIYCYLRDNYSDSEIMSPLLENGAVPLVTNHLPSCSFIDKHLPRQIIIESPSVKCIDLKGVDLEFVLEYNFRRYGMVPTLSDILPRVHAHYAILKSVLRDGDIIVTGNSGAWYSRLIYEIGRYVGARVFFLESFLFPGSVILSEQPYEFSIYGDPELLRLVESASPSDGDFYAMERFVESRETKYQQPVLPLTQYFDHFVVGQNIGDTNVVLSGSVFNNSEDLAFYIAHRNSQAHIAYKKHPRMYHGDLQEFEIGFNRIRALPNMNIMSNHIYDLIMNSNVVHTISSTVGLEAELRSRKVVWYSKTLNSSLNLVTDLRRAQFFHACNHCVDKQKNLASLLDRKIKYSAYGH